MIPGSLQANPSLDRWVAFPALGVLRLGGQAGAESGKLRDPKTLIAQVNDNAFLAVLER